MPRFSPLLVAAGLILFAALAGLTDNPAYAEATAPADDGWRRTADGWERVEDWHLRRSAPTAPISTARRWDFHPAGLALLQVLAIAGAYAGLGTGSTSGVKAAVSIRGDNRLAA